VLQESVLQFEETWVQTYLSSDPQTIINRETWNAFVSDHPTGHLLQTWAWGELKSRFGWQVTRLAIAEEGRILAGAQVLFRPVPPAFSLAYIPKGPLVDWGSRLQTDALLSGLHGLSHSKRSAFLKIEPNTASGHSVGQAIDRCGFIVSRFTVQPPRTILVDLAPAEEDILAAMKQKTRYNIRLAARKGVTIRLGAANDVPIFYRLMQVTGQRDRFGTHSLEYFRAAFELFSPDRGALLLAEVAEKPVASLIVFAQGSRAYYLFGASSNTHREKMPTYLLQWEAMRWAKAHGCQDYDLWGVPDADEADLEAEFVNRGKDSSGLWGVYRFKRGFGGQVQRAIGAFDFVYNRPLYWAYQQWMARRDGEVAA
jgi:peptidoglycan pentaglycine glycine transferase (the first glycine)